MKKAFTLIELLIVIAIIGILLVAFLPLIIGDSPQGMTDNEMRTQKKACTKIGVQWEYDRFSNEIYCGSERIINQ